MKKILILIFFSFGLFKSYAQLSFPNGTVLDLETTHATLYIETGILFHTGNYTVTDYNWSRAFIDSLDPRWDFQACMNGDCKIGLPASGSFISNFGMNDTTGYIRFHVSTFNLSGKSTVKYYVTNNLDPADNALLTFNINYRNTTAVENIGAIQPLFWVYPNPTSGSLNIKGLVESDSKIRIYNTLSELVYEGMPNENSIEQSLSITSLPEGIYHLVIGEYRQAFVVKY